VSEAAPEPATLVLVEDHPLFRQGLRQEVENDLRFRIAGEASDGVEGLALLKRLQPALAVLDLNLPRMSGLDIVSRVAELELPTRLVVLTMVKDESAFNAAMRAGVAGFVLKDGATSEIIDCLVAVAAGGVYVSPACSGFLLRRRARIEEQRAGMPLVKLLTTAERRVLKRIAAKRSTKDIAAEFNLSPRTIEAHRANICGKLKLKGSNSLLQFAIENRDGLEDLD
jgi:DNA-binding NarL/FixJ family response regulator